MANLRNQTCCFTGHRDIKPVDEEKILIDVPPIIDELLKKDVIYYGVGGALGFDTLMAKYMIERRKQDRRIKIIEVLPFQSFRNQWSDEQRKEAAAIDAQMDKIVYCYKHGSKEAYLGRDRHLVDFSSNCISYCNRKSGGTAYTVRYAKACGLSVHNLAPYDIFAETF